MSENRLRNKKGVRWGMMVLAFLGASRAAADDSPRVASTRLLLEAAVADPSYDVAVDAFKATLPRDSRGNLIIEGDILISEDELGTYLEDLGKRQESEGGTKAVELLLATFDGQASFWPRGNRKLTYVVVRSSFRTPQEAELAAQAMALAVSDWESRCPECGIDFEEIAAGPTAQPMFTVSFVAGAQPIARAFFPYNAPSQRKVEIFEPFFASDLGFDRRGVLRHELGHTLGYRHEHTRGVNGCYFEDGNWIALTPYDSSSVMHYLCGGAGNAALEITDWDEKGHRCVYQHDGPPCP